MSKPQSPAPLWQIWYAWFPVIGRDAYGTRYLLWFEDVLRAETREGVRYRPYK